MPATVGFLDEPPSCLLQTNALLTALLNSPGGRSWQEGGGETPGPASRAALGRGPGEGWGEIPRMHGEGSRDGTAIPCHGCSSQLVQQGQELSLGRGAHLGNAGAGQGSSSELQSRACRRGAAPRAQGSGLGASVSQHCPEPLKAETSAHAPSSLQSQPAQPVEEKGSKRGV